MIVRRDARRGTIAALIGMLAYAASVGTVPAAPVGPDDCLGVPDGNPCDDGDPCTIGDACAADVCAGGPSFVAVERGRIGPRARLDADVAVNDTAGRLSLGRRTTSADGVTVSADMLRLGAQVDVARIAFNDLNRGAVRATVRELVFMPLGLPVVGFLPALGALGCGGAPVVVARGETGGPLAPGSYDTLVVQNGGSLLLAPGVFSFCALHAGRRAVIEATGAAVVNVVGDVALGNGARLGPGPGMPRPHLNTAAPTVRLAHDTTVQAHLTAPTSALKIGRNVTLDGTWVVASVVAGARLTLGCRPPAPAAQPPAGAEGADAP